MNHLRRSRFVVLAVLAISCGGGHERDIRYESFGEGLCPAATVVKGVDVAQYQGSINWTSVKGAGIGFAIARISDGDLAADQDPDFASNWTGMKSAGLVRGAYQYFEPGQDPTTQANIVVKAVGTLGTGDLPVVADMETTGGQSAATIVANLQTWVSVVKSGTGKTPMIYTAEGYWDSDVNSSAFASNPLWVANWGVSCPSIPNGWSSFEIWQYSDSGSVAGISGNVDLDEFNGTQAQLETFAGGAAAPFYGASYVSQSWPLATSTITITAGDTMAANIVLKNSGTATWNSSTRLATSDPEDRVSPFYDSSSWVSDNRLAAVAGTVAPGATFTFNFVWQAPTTPGMYDEHYGMVQDGVTWFSAAGQGGPPDTDMEAKFNVVAAPDAGQPPIDAGHPPDAGERDAGAHDAGTAPVDAGPMNEDAGPPFDAGLPGGDDVGFPADAGFEMDGDSGVIVPVSDAGFVVATNVDAGHPAPSPSSGCGCGSSPGGAAAFGLALLRLRRRRAPKAMQPKA